MRTTPLYRRGSETAKSRRFGLPEHRILVLTTLTALLALTTASAEPIPKKVVGSLASQLKGRVAFLRQPLRGAVLKFASDGRLLSPFEAGTWPAHTGFLVESVKTAGSMMTFDGKRVLTYFTKTGMRQSVVTTEKLHVDVSLNGVKEPAQLYSALKWVFRIPGLTPDGEAAPRAPKPDPLTPGMLRTVGQLTNGELIYCCGKDFVPPKPLESPDAVFPVEMRKKHFEGKVVLYVIVDAEGNVRTIRVVRGLHPLFEAAAAVSLKDWRFEPAMLNGEPVAAATNVEMNFRLTRREY